MLLCIIGISELFISSPQIFRFYLYFNNFVCLLLSHFTSLWRYNSNISIFLASHYAARLSFSSRSFLIRRRMWINREAATTTKNGFNGVSVSKKNLLKPRYRKLCYRERRQRMTKVRTRMLSWKSGVYRWEWYFLSQKREEDKIKSSKAFPFVHASKSSKNNKQFEINSRVGFELGRFIVLRQEFVC